MSSVNILDAGSEQSDIERLAGNKGIYLFLLTQRGIPVPPWVTLGCDVFEGFLQSSAGADALERQLRLLQQCEKNSNDKIKHIADTIVRLLEKNEVNEQLRELIQRAVGRIGAAPLAIRSSGLEEDGADFSFAGQFDSYLGVSGIDNIIDHVKKCWLSVFSLRSLLYRKQHDLDLKRIRIAVILQALVPAEKSGVAFTVNATTGNPYEMIVSAVYGLGEGLVSGLVDADTLTINKSNGKVLTTVVGEKRQRVDTSGISSVDERLRKGVVLSDYELETLRKLCLEIESVFGGPQDIEWCIAKDKLWILQSRPVTQVELWPQGEVQIWDNSNIVENYPGVTSTLTFTFTQHLYSNVFREYCRLLKIPRKQLKQMDGFFPAVLGHIYGRVYYNLLHWYKLASVNPLQKLGRETMEVQMGVDTPLQQAEFTDKIAPYHCDSKREYWIIRVRTGLQFAWFFLRLNANVREFCRRFYRLYEHYNKLKYSAMLPDQVFSHYKKLENEIISLWGTMISIESSIGLPYGVLRYLIKHWLRAVPGWFEVAVIGGVDDIESIQPAKRLQSLAQFVRKYPELERFIRGTPSQEVYGKLKLREDAEFLDMVEAYIAEFGYRCRNELKLEEPDLRNDTGYLFELIKTSLDTSPDSQTSFSRRNEQMVDELLKEQLGPVKRLIFNLVRKRVQAGIRNRETVRFCRSRVFGVFRNMFRAMAGGMRDQGIIEFRDDVFHLRLDEIKGCFEATLSWDDIGNIVKQRRADFERYHKMSQLPARFITRGPVITWLKKFAAKMFADSVLSHSGAMTGISCSAGTASGNAMVVKEPEEFKQGVLVTYRTDPGWVAVFPSAKAILVERGSPLTHASIVARELGIPTIVQITNLTRLVTTGMPLEVDGDRGVVTIVGPVESVAIPEVVVGRMDKGQLSSASREAG